MVIEVSLPKVKKELGEKVAKLFPRRESNPGRGSESAES